MSVGKAESDNQPQPGTTPVFQLSAFPTPVDPDLFKNALSPTRPVSMGGSYVALREFYNLVDRIPYFQRTYFPGHLSSEELYGRLLTLSDIASDAPSHVKEVFYEAKRMYEQASLDDMTGIGARYRPHFPNVDNWWDLETVAPTKLTLESLTPQELPTAATLPGTENLAWQLEGFPGAASLAPETTLKEISFKLRLVLIERPWLEPLLFQFGKYIEVQGLEGGWFSSGSFTENGGSFPLLPIGFLVVADVTIKATWGHADQSVVDLVREGSIMGSLGPFVVGTSSWREDKNHILQRLDPTVCNKLLEKFPENLIPLLEGNLQKADYLRKNKEIHVQSEFDDAMPPSEPIYNPLDALLSEPPIEPEANYRPPRIMPPLPLVPGELPPEVIDRLRKFSQSRLQNVKPRSPVSPPPDPETIYYPDPQIVGWISILLPKLPH